VLRSDREILDADLNCSESCGRRLADRCTRRHQSAANATSVLACGWRNDILRDTADATQRWWRKVGRRGGCHRVRQVRELRFV